MSTAANSGAATGRRRRTFAYYRRGGLRTHRPPAGLRERLGRRIVGRPDTPAGTQVLVIGIDIDISRARDNLEQADPTYEDGIVDIEELRIHPRSPRGVLPAINDWLAHEGTDFSVRSDMELYGVTAHPAGFLQRTG